jgi:flagella basal body P-ring formation protein FlgA
MRVNALTFMRIIAIACALLFGLFAVSAFAQDAGLQPLAAVRLAAERALRQAIDPGLIGVQLSAATLDPRLRVPACGAALETHVQPPRGAQSRVPVRVSCSQGAAWSLNVPVEITREQTVLVLKRAVARGETLVASDVVVQKRVLAGLASPFVARIEDLVGRPSRRPLPEGTAVSADALSPLLLIHRGQNVTLTASAGGFEVRAPGRAMSDAAAQQRLRVQNLESLKVIEGVAESDGVVRVTP